MLHLNKGLLWFHYSKKRVRPTRGAEGAYALLEDGVWLCLNSQRGAVTTNVQTLVHYLCYFLFGGKEVVIGQIHCVHAWDDGQGFGKMVAVWEIEVEHIANLRVLLNEQKVITQHTLCSLYNDYVWQIIVFYSLFTATHLQLLFQASARLLDTGKCADKNMQTYACRTLTRSCPCTTQTRIRKWLHASSHFHWSLSGTRASSSTPTGMVRRSMLALKGTDFRVPPLWGVMTAAYRNSPWRLAGIRKELKLQLSAFSSKHTQAQIMTHCAAQCLCLFV